MSELKRCPFCGSEAITTTFIDPDDFEYMPIEVNDCDAEVTCENERCINGWYLSPNQWNTRPIEDALNKRIVELEEQVWDLNLANEKLESAYFADETIAPDGTLKPSVRKLLERLEKSNTDCDLAESHVTALLNRIAELEADSVQIQYICEDELPEGISDEVFSAMYACSTVDFVRVYPYITIDGHKRFLFELPEVQE